MAAHTHAAGTTVVHGACDEEPGPPHQRPAQALDAAATASNEVLRPRGRPISRRPVSVR